MLNRCIPASINSFFTRGHRRSVKAKKNILASFLLRGTGVVISFALVRVTLDYLDVTKYGIWLTLSSVIHWLVFFDVGLGNGLRNKFAQAIAKNQEELAKTYVSTTYATLCLIIGVAYVLFLIINPLLNWAKILNTTSGLANDLSLLALIIVTFFSLHFVLKLIGVILTADQKPAIKDSFELISSLLSLVIIYILTKTTPGSLLYLGTTRAVTPAVVLLIASCIFFNRDYIQYKPSLKYVNFKYFKELASLGIQFFVLQVAVLVLFSTDNVIITQLFEPAAVTPYNISFKYFSIITMIFVVIITPFWSAFTEAYVKKDIKWVKNSIQKLIYIWVILSGLALVMLFLSNFAYKVWIGNAVNIPFSLSVGMLLFVVINMWYNIFIYFINGVGKIRLQLYIAIIVSLFNIPLSILLAKYVNLGPFGVILATFICLLGYSICAPIQYYKIINNRAHGIWAK